MAEEEQEPTFEELLEQLLHSRDETKQKIARKLCELSLEEERYILNPHFEELCKIEDEQVIDFIHNKLISNDNDDNYRIISWLSENRLATDLLIDIAKRKNALHAYAIKSLSKQAINGNTKAIEYLSSLQKQFITDLFSGRLLPMNLQKGFTWYSHSLIVEHLDKILHKFKSNLRSKIIDTFFNYFTADSPIIPQDEFWKYTEYVHFWLMIGKFHDTLYSKEMRIEEVTLFFDKEIVPMTDEILELFKSLGGDIINPSDFGVKINKYPNILVKYLFRNSIPRFNSNLRRKSTEIFMRYFFNDDTYPINDLWKFVDYKDFWCHLRYFHDHIYSKSMTFSEAIQYFIKTLTDTEKERDFGNDSKGDDFTTSSVIKGDPPDSPATMPRKLKSKKKEEEEL